MFPHLFCECSIVDSSSVLVAVMCGAGASSATKTESPSQTLRFRLEPSANFHKKIALPLRSYWRFASSEALAYGNVEIRRKKGVFRTKVTFQFCAVTRDGKFIVYGNNEMGIVIDLLRLRSHREQMTEKNIGGIVTPRWKVMLCHRNGDRITVCVWGKEDIARWRSAIYEASHPNSQEGRVTFTIGDGLDSVNSDVNEEENKNPGGLTAALISPTLSLLNYWNHPAAGRQMTSPNLFHALSQLQLLRQTVHDSASHRLLAVTDSVENERATALERTVQSASPLSGGRYGRKLSGSSLWINTIPALQSTPTMFTSGIQNETTSSTVFHSAFESTPYTTARFDLFEDFEDSPKQKAVVEREWLRERQGWGAWKPDCSLLDGQEPLPDYLTRPVIVLPKFHSDLVDKKVIVGEYLGEMIATYDDQHDRLSENFLPS